MRLEREASEIGYFTRWNFPKKAWLIIVGELCVIASLSVWLYATYLNDLYFQAYTNSLAPVIVPVLSVAFGICSASLATYLYLGMRKIRPFQEPETHLKKTPAKKAVRRSNPPNESETASPQSEKEISPKLRPLTTVYPPKPRKGVPKDSS